MIIEIKDIPGNQIIKTIDIHIDFLNLDSDPNMRYKVIYEEQRNGTENSENSVSKHQNGTANAEIADSTPKLHEHGIRPHQRNTEISEISENSEESKEQKETIKDNKDPEVPEEMLYAEF